MITITIAEVIELHNKLIEATEGSHGVRDMGMLESAVLGCYQSFGGEDLYPSIIEKAVNAEMILHKNAG